MPLHYLIFYSCPTTHWSLTKSTTFLLKSFTSAATAYVLPYVQWAQNSLDFMLLLSRFTFVSLEPTTRKCTRNLGIKLETGRLRKKTHNWVRKASKWFKHVRWIRTMNHRGIINWILTIEFAFNNFVKCLLLFECFESPNNKSLLKNMCGEDKQDCFNIFLGQNLSPTLYAG